MKPCVVCGERHAPRWEHAGPLRLFGDRAAALAYARQERAVCRLDPGSGFGVMMRRRVVRLGASTLPVYVVGTRRRLLCPVHFAPLTGRV